ncbi:MAG: LysR family transcriptional regulator [Hamadaea sp.]|uniref:LysR family transcriptional regulator n=1 Tax=Hamadaea sp. TaxID=2024425 RepID=UPI0017EC5959|nr:LysR substrate-binding domain-containing protein [Hamadaea sp.]NUT22488.1 LysR family transcriptional regulator [Hamadaea sp.]
MDLRRLRYFVVVAEERHFGRAAERLHMAQPPLSRSIQQLEAELGHRLLHRSATGVSLTPAGEALYAEAQALLEQADRIPIRVAAAAGTAMLTIGMLADSAEQIGPHLVTEFRAAHPEVNVRMREADLTDPSCGLKTGLVDVALTRTPFHVGDGIATHVLRTDPIGVVVRADDPLAQRAYLRLDDLANRRRFRLPDDTDAVWRDYWNAAATGVDASGPVVRTLRECLQSVLWNGAIGLMPLADTLPDGLICVPVEGLPPSDLVVAWTRGTTDPLVRSFLRAVAAVRGPVGPRG